MADPNRPFAAGGNPNHLLPMEPAKRAGEKKNKAKNDELSKKVFSEVKDFPFKDAYWKSAAGNRLTSKLLRYYCLISGAREHLFNRLNSRQISEEAALAENALIKAMVKRAEAKKTATEKGGGFPVPVPSWFHKKVKA